MNQIKMKTDTDKSSLCFPNHDKFLSKNLVGHDPKFLALSLCFPYFILKPPINPISNHEQTQIPTLEK